MSTRIIFGVLSARVLPVILLVILLGAIAPMFERIFGMQLPELRPLIWGLQTLILLVSCGVLATRVISRHPAGRSNYLCWLMTTPWRAGMPLPLGPLTPAMEDVFALVVLAATMEFVVGSTWLLPTAAFAGVYAALAMVKLSNVGPRVAAVVLWIGFIGLVRAIPHLDVICGMVFVLYGIAHVAMLRSLRTFPWGRDEDKLPVATLGVGYQRLSPRLQPEKISTSMAVGTTLMFGWAAYCLTWWHDHFGDPHGPGPMTFIVGGLVLSAFFRLVIYTAGYHSPQTFWGRIWTGRLIIPGYDYVFIGPALAALAATALPFGLMGFGVDDAIAIGIAVAVTLPILIFCPPTLNWWRFTGAHRIILPGPQTSLDRSSRSRPKRLLAEPQ